MRPSARMLLQWSIQSTVRARYAIDCLLYRADPEATSFLRELRRETAGKPCLIVGNGPSLNSTPLDDFLHVTSIGMNKIDLIYQQVRWRPAMVLCVNNLVVRQHRAEFNRSSVPVFLAWKCRWFMKGERGPNVHYFKNLPTRKFSTNASDGIAALSPTVTYAALQFAYYLGANPVILFGVDHKFDSPSGRSGIEKRTKPDLNHFSPNYFETGQYWGLPDLEGSEASYRAARRAFEDDGREVLDATIDGALDVFPKVTLEQARQIAGKPGAMDNG